MFFFFKYYPFSFFLSIKVFQGRGYLCIFCTSKRSFFQLALKLCIQTDRGNVDLKHNTVSKASKYQNVISDQCFTANINNKIRESHAYDIPPYDCVFQK